MTFTLPLTTFTFTLLRLTLLLSFFFSTLPEAEAINLRGAGASFPNEVYQAWIPAYKAHRQAHVRLNMSYRSVGSGSGKAEIVYNYRNIEYAGSDSLLKDSERNGRTDLVLFPTMAGGAVMAYNLPHCDHILNLTRDHVVGIYNGTYRLWNDSSLQSSNPSCTMPEERVLVIARRDKSGTTSMFTEALSSFSAAWAAKYGVFSAGVDEETDTAIKWDKNVVHMFGQGNNGMSGLVKSLRYSIGYMVVNAAHLAKLNYAYIQNRAGIYTRPTSKAVQAAMDSHSSGNLTVNIADGALADAYPIASFTYLIMYRTAMIDCNSARELVRYTKWFMEDALPKKECENKLMVPLSDVVVKKIREEILKTVTCNGQNMWTAMMEEIAEETKSEDSWLLAVYISVPLFSLVLLFMLGYILWQRYKLFRMIDSDEWDIPIEDILFFEDKQQMSTCRSRLQCAMSVKSFVSVADIPDGEEMVSQILQWPGKWKSNVIGVRLMEVKELREVTRAMKKAMLGMRDTLIHANVVRFFGLTELESERYVIEEYCSKGSMVDILQNDKYNLNNDFKFSLAADIVNGMAFLHGNNIVHGALTSTCCIIDARWTVKIGDWEYCQLLTTLFPKKSPLLMMMHLGDEDKSSHAASFRDFWVAPEIIKAEFMQPPSFSADVYSFAIILHEIYTREDPYAELADSLTPQQVVRAVCNNHLRPQHTEDIPVRMRQITEIAWSDNPTFRPSFDQIAKMLRQNRTSRKSVLDSMMEAMEEYTHHLEEQVAERSAEVMLAKQNLENFLTDSVPQHLVQRMANGEAAKLAAVGDSSVQGRVYANLGLVTFDVLNVHEALMHAPSRDVLVFLNDLCAGVDGIVTRSGAYRAAVQGDTQTILVGLESETTFLDQRCATVAHLAFDLTYFISNMAPIASGSHPTSLSVRAGVHVGKVVTGVVGGAAPRFVVLGEGVEVTKALVWCSEPGRVRASRNVFSHLEKNLDFVSEEAGWIVCAGMEMESFWISLRIPKKAESVPSDNSVDSGVEVEKSRPNSRGGEDSVDGEQGTPDVIAEENVPASLPSRRFLTTTTITTTADTNNNSSGGSGGSGTGGGEVAFQRFQQPNYLQVQSQQRQLYRQLHQQQMSRQVLGDISEEDERQNSPLFFQQQQQPQQPSYRDLHHQQQQSTYRELHHQQQQLQPQPSYRELHHHQQQQQQRLPPPPTPPPQQQPTYSDVHHQQQQQQQQQAPAPQHQQLHPALQAFSANHLPAFQHLGHFYYQLPEHIRHAATVGALLTSSDAGHFIPAVTVIDDNSLTLANTPHEDMGDNHHNLHHQHPPPHQQPHNCHFVPVTYLGGRKNSKGQFLSPSGPADRSGYTNIPVSTHTARSPADSRNSQTGSSGGFVIPELPAGSSAFPDAVLLDIELGSPPCAQEESDNDESDLASRECHELQDLSREPRGSFSDAAAVQETQLSSTASDFNNCAQQQQQQQQQQQTLEMENTDATATVEAESEKHHHHHQQEEQQQPDPMLSPERTRSGMAITCFSPPPPPPAPCLPSPLTLTPPGNLPSPSHRRQRRQRQQDAQLELDLRSEFADDDARNVLSSTSSLSRLGEDSLHIESVPDGLQIRRVKRGGRRNSAKGKESRARSASPSRKKGKSKKANKIHPGRLL